MNIYVRLGEPAWTEILRAIIRFILLGVLVSYIAYSTLNAMNSSITSQEKKEDVIKMPLPDIRVCSRFEEFEGDETYFDAVTAICDFGDGRDCSPYFYPVKNPDYLPVLDDGSRSRNCMVFIPPLDIYFHTGPDTDSSLSNDQIELRLFRKNVTQHIIMFYLTYYPNQNSPYRTLFKMNGDDTKMSIQDAEDQLRIEKDTKILKNTYDFGVDCFATTTYSLTKAQTLTNSSWNYFGFSNIYEVKHSITTYFGPKSAIAISDIFIRPTLMVRVKPNEYSIRLIIEQKVSTILGGLASVGGVLSVIMFVQTLLFGFRPNSPWGIIHRWSWGRRGVMLRDQLRNEFNTDDSPVPIVTRVRGDSSLPELSDSTILGIVALNENDNVQNDGSKLKKMEDRIQLMEDLFKAYYIDDEIFQKLNEARKEDPRRSEEKKEKMKRASGFTTLNQEDDKASINQTDQKGKSKVLP
jgi:hypothetical protein